MTCHKCPEKSVIELQHGDLCKNHFLSYFEEKVFKTINKYNLVGRKDRICVATSGGKDSLTVLYLIKKYLEKNNISSDTLFALAVDEGIHNYREKTLVDLRKFCSEHDIRLEIVSYKEEFKHTLNEAYPVINKGTNKKPCNICGVWRRYSLNKYARKLGATKVITGHNLDDEAQAIIMNLFKANTALAAHLGPISGVQEHNLFVQRIKPLYLCPEKEVKLYTILKGFQVQFAECPYSKEGYRSHIQDMLNGFEAKYKGTKQGIVNSFLDLLPALKEKEIKNRGEDGTGSIQECTSCGEPAHANICNACTFVEVLRHEG